MKKVIGFVKSNLLLIFLVLQPFLDILAYFQSDSAVSLAGYFRLAVTVALPVYVLFFTKERKKFIAVMSVIVGFCALHTLNTLRDGFAGAFSDVKYMLLVAHMPVLLFCFMFLYEKASLLKQISTGLIINVITSVVAFYLSYALNSGNCTYPLFQMGWTGWYVIPNAQSIILSSLIPFALYFSIKYCKYYFPLTMLPLIYMYTLNGTKATFGAMLASFGAVAGFCFVEFVFIKDKRSRFQIYKSAMAVFLVAVSLLCYTYSPRQIMDSTAESNRLEEQADLDKLMEEDKDDKEKEDEEELKGKYFYLTYINPNLVDRFGPDKVLDAYGENLNSYGLSDMRLKKLIYARLVWDESDFVTRMVGFEYTKMQHKDDNFDLENDPPAILYYYGYIGAALFLLLMAYFIARLIKQLITKFKDSFNLFNFIVLVALGLQIVSAIYSGYLLRRPNVAIYLGMVLLLIYCRTEPLFKKKTEGQK